MKIAHCILHVCLIILCLNLKTIASPPLETTVKTLQSKYGNILGEDAKKQLFDYLIEQGIDTSTTDLNIEIKFLTELESMQSIRKKSNEHYYYQVIYKSPTYKVSITEGSEQVFKKIYGGESKKVFFEKNEKHTNAEILLKNWRSQRDVFFKHTEQKHNHIDTFLVDLKNELPQISSLINNPVSYPDTLADSNPSDFDNSTILEEEEEEEEEEEDTTSSTSTDQSDKENISKTKETLITNNTQEVPPPSLSLPDHEPRDLRNYNKVLSLGMGLGNRKHFKAIFPVLNGALDRYAFDQIFDIDWFFLGGSIGFGKYKYKENESFEMTEIAFVSRYGVSLTRIFQDSNIAPKLTNTIDVYALLQAGYSLILSEAFFVGIDTSGATAGIALGARYSKNKLGFYAEIGRTETGFFKAGIFLKL